MRRTVSAAACGINGRERRQAAVRASLSMAAGVQLSRVSESGRRGLVSLLSGCRLVDTGGQRGLLPARDVKQVQ